MCHCVAYSVNYVEYVNRCCPLLNKTGVHIIVTSHHIEETDAGLLASVSDE